MDNISQEEFDKAEKLIPKRIEKKGAELTEEEFNGLLEEMENPVKVQQNLAVKIKRFLDKRIEVEIKDKGILSEHTRKWVESYNNILEKLQRALHGDKSVNLHLHKVSHSQIATKMREALNL